MPELFKRRVRLTAVTPEGETKQWEGLRITFNIVKNIDATPNKASIRIYNLNADSRAKIQRKNGIVKLDFAYGEEPYEEIFNGEIRFVDQRRERAEIVTTIESGDGDTAFNSILLNETIGPGDVAVTGGVSVKQIFDRMKQIFQTEMRERLGVDSSVSPDYDSIIDEVSQKATGILNGVLLTSSGKFRKGLTLNGVFGNVMEKLSQRVGIDFFMNNQTMYVLKHTDTLNLDPILLTPETGLIGSPIKLEDGGIQVVSLIVPGLICGRELVVESRKVIGLSGWKITRINMIGDTEGSNSFATIDTELLGVERAA